MGREKAEGRTEERRRGRKDVAGLTLPSGLARRTPTCPLGLVSVSPLGLLPLCPNAPDQHAVGRRPPRVPAFSSSGLTSAVCLPSLYPTLFLLFPPRFPALTAEASLHPGRIVWKGWPCPVTSKSLCRLYQFSGVGRGPSGAPGLANATCDADTGGERGQAKIWGRKMD